MNIEPYIGDASTVQPSACSVPSGIVRFRHDIDSYVRSKPSPLESATQWKSDDGLLVVNDMQVLLLLALLLSRRRGQIVEAAAAVILQVVVREF
jgi:hypothetical protein